MGGQAHTSSTSKGAGGGFPPIHTTTTTRNSLCSSLQVLTDQGPSVLFPASPLSNHDPLGRGAVPGTPRGTAHSHLVSTYILLVWLVLGFPTA